MIAKGTQHNNGAKLAQYMITGKPGEHAELFELRGFAADNIKDGFRDVQIMAEGTKCEQPFFHVQVRNPTGEEVTRDQWRSIADRIESKLGLSAQPRAIAFHIEDASGHEHMHIAWSRIDENTMRAKHMPFFKERLKEVSRELEIKFGLTQVSSERQGEIKFGATRAEEEQARRLDFDKDEVRNFIRDCYDRSDCGVSFQAALEEQGFMLAQGGQRGLVVIDHAGGIHSLGKRILDVTATKIRDHLSDLARDELPTVENARALVPGYPGDALHRMEKELIDVQKQIETERHIEISPEHLDEVIYTALLCQAIRNPHLTDEVQILAWKMPGYFAADISEAILAGQEVQARNLELPDIDKQIIERQAHAYHSDLTEIDVLRLDSEKAPPLAYVRVAEKQREHDAEIQRLDAIIYGTLLDQAIRNPHLIDSIQLLAWKMPEPMVSEILRATAVMQEAQARNLNLAEIDALIIEANRQEQQRQIRALDQSFASTIYESGKNYPNYFQPQWQERIPSGVMAEIEALTTADAEREYAQRDPVREDMAWEDAIAKSAIEKEKAKGQFAEQEPPREQAQGSRKKESGQHDQQKPAAPELGKSQGEIRLAYGLTYSAQGFANALEDRGFILARVTPEDIEKDRERIKEQAADRKAPQAWMEHEGGYSGLDPELQASAKRSYDAWDEDKRKRYGLQDYVLYAQRKWREEGQRSILEGAKGNPVVINAYGNAFLLTERNTGDDRATLSQYLKGIDQASLLTVTEAKEVMQDYQQHRRDEWQHKQSAWEESRNRAAKRPISDYAADIRLAYNLSQSARGFVENLEERGFRVARVTEQEADRSHRVADFAKELGRFAPEFRDGEYVAINQRGYIYGLDRRTTGEEREEVEKFMGTLNPLNVKGIQSVLKTVEAERRAEFEQRREKERTLAATGPLNEDLADIRLAYALSQSPDGFARNLEERGFAIARATKRDADRSQEEAAAAKAVGRFAPEYREGEYVAINQWGHVYSLNRKATGESREDVDAFMRTMDDSKIEGIEREKERILAAAGPLKQDMAEIRLAYALSQSPDGFAKNLDECGFKIACATKEEADRSHQLAAFSKAVGGFAPEYREGEYVAINERGHVYSLNRKTTGESREEVDAFMRTGDHTKILGIEDTRRHIAAYKRPAPARGMFPTVPNVEGIAISLPSHAQPLNTWQQFGAAAYEGAHRDTAPDHIKGPSADIWTAFVRSDNARAFVAALEEKNIAIAIVTREDVANSQIDRTYETNLKPAPTPKLREGDYVAVTDDARVYNLNKRTAGESAERVQKFMASLDGKEFQSVYATLSAVHERAATHEKERQAFRDLSAGHLKKARDPRPNVRRRGSLRTNDFNLDDVLGLTGAVGNTGARSVSKAFDLAATAFESLITPTLTPEQIYEGEKSVRRRAAEAEQSIDFARHTAEISEQRRQQDNEHEAERRQVRERGGRER